MGDSCDMEPEVAQDCIGKRECKCKVKPRLLSKLGTRLDMLAWRVKHFLKRWQKSYMVKWAEREIDIAIERERQADREDCEKRGKKYNPKEFSYGVAIYKSALKAFKTMLKDEHSGMSWSFTRATLTRLMNRQPLSPLQGTDDEWSECIGPEPDGTVMYQNVRYAALFKTVKPDGTVTYNDNDRVTCVDDENHNLVHHFHLSAKEVDAIEPITFPYIPPTKPIKVYDRVFSTTGKPGEFDTVGILRVEFPDGRICSIGKYYKESGKEFVQIDKGEYDLRLEAYESHKMDK